MHEKVFLIICDGWGLGPPGSSNAISQACTPNWDAIRKRAMQSVLRASDTAVGLPHGQMGNSEVGHLNIGAGRVIDQEVMQINRSIESGSLMKNPVLIDAFNKAKTSSLHLMGLLSDGGVHSDLDHLIAFIHAAHRAGVTDIRMDAFLDGRDTEPKSAMQFIRRMKEETRSYTIARFSSIGGRYFGMDRDKHWDRLLKGYDAILGNQGLLFNSAEEALEAAYGRGETDEFVTPSIISADGLSHPVNGGEVFLFFNYRADRAREITRALTDQDFERFPRNPAQRIRHYYCLTPYDETFQLPVLFDKKPVHPTLGEVISDHGLNQLRIAETEKYAHVTFFFNGGREEPYPGEDRILIPSPPVATYDLKPSMSALEVTDNVIRVYPKGYDFILLNFANLDMVGHTGDMQATIQAVEIVDQCLGKLVEVFSPAYDLIITADHGNAEQMLDEKGNVQTAHSMNPVPLLYLSSRKREWRLLPCGYLKDIADLVLRILNIPKPIEMEESRLITHDSI
ncbi:2,3-bisphosphoglycerate-independent phosphoglycerate mutase [bacterium]|nr:2,3-bisphosphoglycerate-independent phosphoglycerate mutase [bacterium]